MHKVAGSINNADAMTKNVPREILERHMQAMSGVYVEGRAEKAVQLHCLDREIRQLRFELRKMRCKTEESLNTLSRTPKVLKVEDEPNHDAHFEDSYIESLVNHIENEVDDIIEQARSEWCNTQCRQRGISARALHLEMKKMA